VKSELPGFVFSEFEFGRHDCLLRLGLMGTSGGVMAHPRPSRCTTTHAPAEGVETFITTGNQASRRKRRPSSSSGQHLRRVRDGQFAGCLTSRRTPVGEAPG
jgi:hypothetical protein